MSGFPLPIAIFTRTSPRACGLHDQLNECAKKEAPEGASISVTESIGSRYTKTSTSASTFRVPPLLVW